MKNMIKLAVAAGLAISTAASFAAQAGLHLCQDPSSTYKGQLTVKCNDIDTKMPVPANDCVKAPDGSYIIGWDLLKLFGTPTTCVFSAGSTTIGSATLSITGSGDSAQGQVTSVTIPAGTGFSVTPSGPTPAKSILKVDINHS